MDERYTCLKKDDVQEFHNHLNSVKPNIQFTKEVEEESRLSGLHNQQGVRRDTSVFIRNWNIAQKQTDLDHNSHHPVQHERSAVDTFRHRAGQIPLTEAERSRERKVFFVVDQNLEIVRQTLSRRFWQQPPFLRDLEVIWQSFPVRGISEKISRMLRHNNVGFLLMFYTLASHGPRTQLYSQEVWFTKSVALTAISVIMDKQIEPWQHKTKRVVRGI